MGLNISFSIFVKALVAVARRGASGKSGPSFSQPPRLFDQSKFFSTAWPL